MEIDGLHEIDQGCRTGNPKYQSKHKSLNQMCALPVLSVPQPIHDVDSVTT